MSKNLSAALRAGTLAIALATLASPSWSQGATGSGMTGGTTTGTPTTVVRADTDDGMDWGWIGLLGLAGLAGLRRREPKGYDNRTTTTR